MVGEEGEGMVREGRKGREGTPVCIESFLRITYEKHTYTGA